MSKYSGQKIWPPFMVSEMRNCHIYRGRRYKGKDSDPRLELMPPELFKGKSVLDIGCNTGNVSIVLGL